MSERDSFLKKNFSTIHIIGIILGWILAVVYWYKSGKYTDNILKNNVILISIWGILIGYITFDFIKNAMNKKEDNE